VLKQPQFRIRARELRANIRRQSFPALESMRDVVDCQGMWVMAEERAETLRLVTEAAGIKKLHLIGMPVDVLVEVGAFGAFLSTPLLLLVPFSHFSTSPPSLRGAVPLVTSFRNRDWPVTSPRGGATQVGRVTTHGSISHKPQSASSSLGTRWWSKNLGPIASYANR
jgi:hypothetical protein